MIELQDIKGLGPKNLKLLEKLGINNSNDLLTYYPYRYDILKRSNVSELNDGDKIIIDGIIENIPSIFRYGRKADKMSFRLNTGYNLFNVTIFNRGFLRSKLNPGEKVTIIGKLDMKYNTIVASDIKFMSLGDTTIIDPVYHLTNGISNKQFTGYINALLDGDISIKSYIPDYLIEKYDFLDKETSIRTVHHPKNPNYFKRAIAHLKYEELFLFMLKMNYMKHNFSNLDGLSRNIDKKLVDDFIEKLPFKLTIDQLKSVDSIYEDLTSKYRMNRLLQGDVGSGKTIVSFIAMYINSLSGYQSALMAPTEILAVQHYENIKNIFKDYNINIGLLTGKLKAKEKKDILNKLSTGEINIIIGTHALIQDDVKYNNLGLVITDEQHRFGVLQRSNLKNKGITPDILYMSATPIPRTYALSLYGDMDISSIRTMPEGRKKVITTLKKESEIKDVLTDMYRELKLNHQVYVIAPLIEESDNSDMENVYELETKMNKAFGKLYKIGVLHGKMTSSEKDEVMNKFKNNEIQILISTTVIEVGVDVKNATMMVIFDSYRFGLSALHQLRGRVGRSQLQSYCILISNKETERLNVLTKTNDGFEISEEDFKLRGSGDLFGIRQSGDMVFKMADIKRDFNILVKAKEDSAEFLHSQDYVNEKYTHIRNLIENAVNQD